MEAGNPFTLQEYGDLIENLGDGVVVGSRRTGIMLCNRRAAELLGLSRDLLMGTRAADPIWQFVRADGSAMPADEYPSTRVYRTGQAIEGLVLGIDRPGRNDRVWTLVDATPHLDAEGGIAHVVVAYHDITALKLAEEALQDSEARYRAVFDNSPDGILVIDSEFQTFRVANRTIGRFLGYEPEELVGRGFADIHPAASLDHVRACARALAKGEIDVATDIPCVRKDGSIVSFDIRSHLLVIGGRPCLVGRFLDLTDRQRAERALQESRALQASEERYRAVVEDQTELICRFKADGTLTIVNDVLCRFFGQDREHLVGSKWQPQAAAEDLPMIEACLRAQTPDNPVVVIENRVQSGTGETRWMQFVNRAFFDADGRLLETQAVGRDITDHKRADEELAHYRDRLEDLALQRAAELTQSEDRYRRLVDALPDAIMVHVDGRFVFANPAAATIFRAPGPEALVGLSLLDLVSSNFKERVGRRIQDVYLEETVAPRIEEKVIGFDGTEIDVDVETVPVVVGGQPAGLSIVRDITVQRRYEQEMRNSQKLESVGLLAGGIAHDFNNLLSAILGNISLARLEPSVSTEIETRLVQAERAVGRAINLTQQLLTFARGGAPIRQATVLRSLLTETADFALRGSSVACRYDIADDLWAANVDEGQVSQVIHNIVINGQQAMPSGGTLKISARNVQIQPGDPSPLRPGRYVHLSIQDSGIGIQPEHQQRIFDPYFTTKTKGSGLGLAVCHSIVMQHGGRIEVESTQGRGSTFHILLPAAREAPMEARAAQMPAGPAARKGRVLLMDDDKDLLFAQSGILEALGYRTDTATDGQSALRAYTRAADVGNPYDAVILDLTVPGGMGGKEAVERLLEFDPDARVIVSSGYSNDPVMANHAAYGFKGVLPKPCLVDRMAETLRRVISGETEGD